MVRTSTTRSVPSEASWYPLGTRGDRTKATPCGPLHREKETGSIGFRMGSGELSERDVIRGAQAGDERMYRELVSRYVRPALAVAWEFTETLDDAEDLVQEAFRRVVDALHRFDPDRPFAPWFFTILRNLARNAVGERALRLHAALDASVPDERPTPEELVEYRTPSAWLWAALRPPAWQLAPSGWP